MKHLILPALLLAVSLCPLVSAQKPAAPGLSLERKDHLLTIRGPGIPAEGIVVNYLEAYCRGGSTGNFTFTVIAENLAGISKPKSVSLRVFNSISYATWSGSSFPADTPQDQRSPEADPDGDGQANLLEFAFNTLPASSSSVTAPEPGWFSDLSGSYPAITFPVIANRDVTSSVEFSSDMISWDNHAVFVSRFVHTNGTVMETWRAAHPSPASGQPVFGRVRVGQ